MGILDFMKKKKGNVQDVPSAPMQPNSGAGLDTKAMPPLDMPNLNPQANLNQPGMNTGMQNVASSLNPQELNSNNMDMSTQNNSQNMDIPPINVEQNMDAPPMPSTPDMQNNAPINNPIENPVNESAFPATEPSQMNIDFGQEKEEMEFPLSEDESEKLNEIGLEPAANDEMPNLDDNKFEEPMTPVNPILDNPEVKNFEEPMTPIEPLKLNEINQKETVEEPLAPLEPKPQIDVESPVPDMNSDYIPDMQDNQTPTEVQPPMQDPSNQPMDENFSTDEMFTPGEEIQEPSILNEPTAQEIPSELNQPIEKTVVKDSLFLNVNVFKDVSDLINNLGNESKIAEDALLRIKDITLTKEKVYDKWRINLEQIEHELIQLDKLLFNV
jgi:hypothetical protein